MYNIVISHSSIGDLWSTMKLIKQILKIIFYPFIEALLIIPPKILKMALTVFLGLLYIASIYYSFMAVVITYMVWSGQADLNEYWGYILLGIVAFIARYWSKRIASSN